MTELSRAALIAAGVTAETRKFIFFWGHRPRVDGRLGDSVFSQWWACRFDEDGHTYTSAEQFMMAGKARLFGDADALAAILAEPDPAACKRLGRRVRGSASRWSRPAPSAAWTEPPARVLQRPPPSASRPARERASATRRRVGRAEPRA